jgi:DNA-binding transcriptional LysR family regulator
MDLSALQVFVDVIRRGSFAAVARDRRSAPSSISRTIAALERELSVRLFQRSTRTLALTAAWLIYPSRSYLPLKVRRFVDFVGPRLRGLAGTADAAADRRAPGHGAANG